MTRQAGAHNVKYMGIPKAIPEAPILGNMSTNTGDLEGWWQPKLEVRSGQSLHFPFVVYENWVRSMIVFAVSQKLEGRC